MGLFHGLFRQSQSKRQHQPHRAASAAESDRDTRTRDGLSVYFDAFDEGPTMTMPMTQAASTASAASSGSLLDGPSLRRAGQADREEILAAWLACQVYLAQQEHAAQTRDCWAHAALLQTEAAASRDSTSGSSLTATSSRTSSHRFAWNMTNASASAAARNGGKDEIQGIRYEACAAQAMTQPGDWASLTALQQRYDCGWARTQAGCDFEKDWAELQRVFRRSLQLRAKRGRRRG